MSHIWIISDSSDTASKKHRYLSQQKEDTFVVRSNPVILQCVAASGYMTVAETLEGQQDLSGCG